MTSYTANICRVMTCFAFTLPPHGKMGVLRGMVGAGESDMLLRFHRTVMKEVLGALKGGICVEYA